MPQTKPIRSSLLLLFSTLGAASLAFAYQFDLLSTSSSMSRFPRYRITDLGPAITPRPALGKEDPEAALNRRLQEPSARSQLQNRHAVNGSNGKEFVGSSLFAGGRAFHAVLWQAGRIHDLGTLGGALSYAQAINAAGQIVGSSDTADGHRHAFLQQAGQMQDLGTLGGLFSAANAVNDQGWVVGRADDANGASRAFLYKDGQMQDLSIEEELQSEAFSVNNKGQVVGEAYNAAWKAYAFLQQAGQMVNLNNLIPRSSGWNLEVAREINDAGQIRGIGKIRDEIHLYLLTPEVP